MRRFDFRFQGEFVSSVYANSLLLWFILAWCRVILKSFRRSSTSWDIDSSIGISGTVLSEWSRLHVILDRWIRPIKSVADIVGARGRINSYIEIRWLLNLLWCLGTRNRSPTPKLVDRFPRLLYTLVLKSVAVSVGCKLENRRSFWKE